MNSVKIKDLQRGKFPYYKCKKNWELFFKGEIVSAVNKIKSLIRKLPNRDEKIQKFCKTNIMTLDGGGVGRFEVLNIIDEYFKFQETDDIKQKKECEVIQFSPNIVGIK